MAVEGQPEERSAGLSEIQQIVLDFVADREAIEGRAASIEEIHVGLDAQVADDEQTEELLRSLMSQYLEYEVQFPGKTYRLTKAGWLRSKYAQRAAQLVEGTLLLFHDKLRVEPRFACFTWSELKDRGLDLGFKGPSFAHVILGKFDLFWGGTLGSWNRPRDILKLAKLRTLNDLEKFYETARARAAKAAEVEKAAHPDLGGPSTLPTDLLGALDGMGDPLDAWLAVPTPAPITNLHLYAGVNLSATHNSANISNATVGAMSQGESPTATGGATVGAPPSAPAGSGPGVPDASSASADVPQVEAAPAQRAAEAGPTTYSSQIHGSILGAQAQGPGAKAVGIVNQYGLAYADVREIADERVAMALDRLREGVGLAHTRSMEDMLRVSFAVVQSLVAAKLGATPDAASVAEFLQEAVEDPAFPARAARLFQEGAKTPSAERREMLARALFGIPASTPERDRVDAAIERLFTDDVALLNELVLLSRRSEGRSMYLKALLCDGILYAFPRTDGSESEDRVLCLEWPLYALEAVGCVSIGSSSANRTLGKEKNHRSANLTIMPLGRSVIGALEQPGFALVGGKGSSE
jgi:hypothetical protein